MKTKPVVNPITIQKTKPVLLAHEEPSQVEQAETPEPLGSVAASEGVEQGSFYTLEAPEAPAATVPAPKPAVKKISPQMLIVHKKKPLKILPKKKKAPSIQELTAMAIQHAQQQ